MTRLEFHGSMICAFGVTFSTQLLVRAAIFFETKVMTGKKGVSECIPKILFLSHTIHITLHKEMWSYMLLGNLVAKFYSP
jgi:hypothetical protein